MDGSREIDLKRNNIKKIFFIIIVPKILTKIMGDITKEEKIKNFWHEKKRNFGPSCQDFVGSRKVLIQMFYCVLFMLKQEK